jgi:SAM-dependent methyltransferase
MQPSFEHSMKKLEMASDHDNSHLSWTCDRYTSTLLYASRFTGSAGTIFLKRQTELIRRFLGFLDPLDGHTVLDVGAGHGQATRLFVDSGAGYTAFASSTAAYAVLHKTHRELRGKFHCTAGPLDSIPFKDRSFDIVLSLRTFSHVPDWITFMKELCRLAENVVVFDYAPAGIVDFIKPAILSLKRKFESGTRDFTAQRPSDIAREATECGFRVRDWEREFLLPLLLHRRLPYPLLLPVEGIARRTGLTGYVGGPVLVCLERRIP